MFFKVKRISGNYIIFIILIIILILFTTGCTVKLSKADAWTAVQDYIKAKNSYYKKVEFPTLDESFLTKINEGKFKVEAFFTYVPGSNCCDAMVKKKFSCIVELNDGKYIVSDLIFIK